MNWHETLPELGEHEFEFENEFEHEHEFEFEHEHEHGEQFLGGLGNLAMNAAQSIFSNLLSEQELETEFELNPVRRWYPDAALEHMAHEAIQAENENEAAEQFLPLIPLLGAKLLPLAMKAAPLAMKALPKVMNVVSKLTPHLTRGVGNMAKTLFRNPATRQFLRSVPNIAQRTVGNIARQAARGVNVTPRSALQSLARQTAGTLRNPRQLRAIMQRSRRRDGLAHRVIGTPMSPDVSGGAGAMAGAPGMGAMAGAGGMGPMAGMGAGGAGAMLGMGGGAGMCGGMAAGFGGAPAMGFGGAPAGGFAPGFSIPLTSPQTGGCNCAKCPTCGR